MGNAQMHDTDVKKMTYTCIQYLDFQQSPSLRFFIYTRRYTEKKSNILFIRH